MTGGGRTLTQTANIPPELRPLIQRLGTVATEQAETAGPLISEALRGRAPQYIPGLSAPERLGRQILGQQAIQGIPRSDSEQMLMGLTSILPFLVTGINPEGPEGGLIGDILRAVMQPTQRITQEGLPAEWLAGLGPLSESGVPPYGENLPRGPLGGDPRYQSADFNAPTATGTPAGLVLRAGERRSEYSPDFIEDSSGNTVGYIINDQAAYFTFDSNGIPNAETLTDAGGRVIFRLVDGEYIAVGRGSAPSVEQPATEQPGTNPPPGPTLAPPETPAPPPGQPLPPPKTLPPPPGPVVNPFVGGQERIPGQAGTFGAAANLRGRQPIVPPPPLGGTDISNMIPIRGGFDRGTLGAYGRDYVPNENAWNVSMMALTSGLSPQDQAAFMAMLRQSASQDPSQNIGLAVAFAGLSPQGRAQLATNFRTAVNAGDPVALNLTKIVNPSALLPRPVIQTSFVGGPSRPREPVVPPVVTSPAPKFEPGPIKWEPGPMPAPKFEPGPAKGK